MTFPREEPLVRYLRYVPSVILKVSSPLILITFVLISLNTSAEAAVPKLSLEAFLYEVKDKNTAVKGAIIQTQSSQLRSQEGQLLLAPTAFINTQVTVDAKIPQTSLISFDNQVTKTVSFGLKQLTSFGLLGSLHYDLFSQYYNNPISFVNIPGVPSLVPDSYVNAFPVLELTQSLWSNGMGRSTKATQEQIEAQALSSSYSASFQAKLDLTQAETHYWRLAVARQTITVQSQALNRAKKIYDWNVHQARLHLRDESDVVQAEALLQSRELDLLSSKNEEKSAARAFNSSRNINSDQVNDQLVEIDPKFIDQIQVPEKAPFRDDVKAAQQTARASIANSKIALERDLPTFEVFASVALNGQQGYTTFTQLSDAIGPSFSLNRPTETIGIRFTAPLDFSTTRNSRAGWEQESIAAELNYDRKVFEQEQSWKDLNQTLQESKQQLKLSQKLESIQEKKLNIERDRLTRGRTTTYQVLLFEQDYLLAQLVRIRNQATILNIIPQMKLFGESL